ncbi:SIMPL domain-containing protein [Amaricoccus sp.]|uniref:SIMPL domain-containing protein n=1 Tax=Amaricoccus sp. TaxID=1872485 RepID=UPI001B5B9E40|nr:SIMPL domain-containing protein [Amaricoccus sp.]MBP7002605.1 SIMPL domain-containing protein [Amaricoccus sp.]
MRPIHAALTVVALSLPPVALAQGAPGTAPEPRRLTVSGEAEVQAAPDRAAFTAGVQTEALSAADALGATAKAMQAVFAALEAQGVAAADMQTSQLSVDPLWDSPPDGRQPRVRGYAAANMVTVRVRDVAKLGALIDAVGAAGANRIFGISFDVEDPKASLDDARRRAVEDARSRAELLATAAGVTLGPVISIREGGGGGPVPMFARAEAMGDMPVAAGTVSLSASVEIVYGIE